ncbi:MAG: trypsin-like peptidase domain-containing protein [Alphaproteobacteria bacterium]|nr:trypsin-like peptidase domain-containing protein [Alphaproteobacteria bacterium]
MAALAAFAGIGAPGANGQQLLPYEPGAYEIPYDKIRGVHSYAPLIARVRGAAVRVNGYKVKGEGAKSAELTLAGNGSGVVIDAEEGFIVTNAHVLKGIDIASIVLLNGEEIPAELVGLDTDTDIALLRARITGVPALEFSDSAFLEVGDIVFAIGYPRGLDQTVSRGIVSGLERHGFDDTEAGMAVQEFIQTDAAINPGNSGGPLIDSKGRIVGINSFIFTKSGDSSGLGFAIPSRVVVPVIRQLREHGRVSRGRLGVRISALTPKIAKALSVGVNSGAVIAEVRQGSAADRAGLMAGDVVTGAGGERIDSDRDFLNFVRLAEPGKPYVVFVHRGPDVLKLEVVLDPVDGDNVPTPAASGASAFGATFKSPPAPLKPGAEVAGVIVAHVAQGSRAEARGLRSGDNVIALNRVPVEELEVFLQNLKTVEAAVLTVKRGGAEILIVLNP